MVVTKSDKPNKLLIPSIVPLEKICRVSAKKHQLGKLETKISELFSSDLISNLSTYPILSQSWQQAKLVQLIQQLT